MRCFRGVAAMALTDPTGRSRRSATDCGSPTLGAKELTQVSVGSY